MAGYFIAASVAVSVASTVAANSRADKQAAAQNASNQLANEKSTERAEKNRIERKGELLRRFNISSSKMKDNRADILGGTATQLSELDTQLLAASSSLGNTMATRQLTGRLAQRLRTAGSIQGDQAKGNILQATEAQFKDLGNKLETMKMNKETQEMDLDIDTSNAINSANNQMVSNRAYSQSSGLAGVAASGFSAYAGAKASGISWGT